MEFKSNKILLSDYSANGKIINFSEPLIMAIVNLTPNSFYDGGKYQQISEVINDIEKKIEQGADIIDLGAASSKPGVAETSVDEEWRRLGDVLREVRKIFPKTIISIDTYRSEVVEKAAALGADIINDVSGGNLDSKMFFVIEKLNLPYVMMHMQGTPQTMQVSPTYNNVLEEIFNNFKTKISALKEMGFEKIIVDPGFGFGKNLEHNYALLKHLNFFSSLGLPLLAGLSRKSMVNKVLNIFASQALNGTTVLNTLALLNGAHILRVHDVKEAKQAVDLINFYKKIE
jgi:dihydropteroate synthase